MTKGVRGRVRVIGIGSPVVGDEAGMQLVERLRDDVLWHQRDDIEWLVLERPGAALLQYFSGAETVCLIDALDSRQATAVVRIKPEELLLGDTALSSHHFGVAEALQLGNTLKQLPPRLLIFGVTGQPGSYSQLSAMLAESIGS